MKRFVNAYTKCDSGETLNPFLHVFLFVLAALSVGFLFFDGTASVQAFTLYQGTVNVGETWVNLWGVIAAAVVLLHTAAFWIRGRVGVEMMRVCTWGGVYLWVWASVIYLSGGYWLQFLTFALLNLYFWCWYVLQWRKRRRGDRVAFVH